MDEAIEYASDLSLRIMDLEASNKVLLGALKGISACYAMARRGMDIDPSTLPSYQVAMLAIAKAEGKK